MEIKMLEAVIELLDKIEVTEVKCAKVILIKVIEGMKLKCDLRGALNTPVLVPPITPLAPKPPVAHKPNQWEVVVDNGRLKEIKGFPLEGKVNLDGVIMTYENAIGKAFQNASIVEE